MEPAGNDLWYEVFAYRTQLLRRWEDELECSRFGGHGDLPRE